MGNNIFSSIYYKSIPLWTQLFLRVQTSGWEAWIFSFWNPALRVRIIRRKMILCFSIKFFTNNSQTLHFIEKLNITEKKAYKKTQKFSDISLYCSSNTSWVIARWSCVCLFVETSHHNIKRWIILIISLTTIVFTQLV